MKRPTPEGIDYSNPDEWNKRLGIDAGQISPQIVLAIWHQKDTNFAIATQELPVDRTAASELSPAISLFVIVHFGGPNPCGEE